MPVYRIQKTQNYTVMSNRHLQDARLTWKAKGLLSYILSLPDNWDFSAAGLSAASKDGATVVRNALSELEENGYLVRLPIRGESGRIADWEYIILEAPEDSTPEPPKEYGAERTEPVAEKPLVENPQVEKPQVDEPQVDNRAQQNTKRLNTNKQNTDSEKTKSDNNIYNNNYNILSQLSPTSSSPAGDDGEAEELRKKLEDAEKTVESARAASAEATAARPVLRGRAQERFDRWWTVWPKKVCKKDAEREFKKLKPDDALVDRMIAAVSLQKVRDRRFRDGRYIPHPATWLSKGEWENVYDGETKSSFDTDEFFALAVRRGMEAGRDARGA